MVTSRSCTPGTPYSAIQPIKIAPASEKPNLTRVRCDAVERMDRFGGDDPRNPMSTPSGFSSSVQAPARSLPQRVQPYTRSNDIFPCIANPQFPSIPFPAILKSYLISLQSTTCILLNSVFRLHPTTIFTSTHIYPLHHLRLDPLCSTRSTSSASRLLSPEYYPLTPTLFFHSRP